MSKAPRDVWFFEFDVTGETRRENQLEFSGDEMEEGMSYYDEESLSLCGVEDFLQVVKAYREFLQQK